MKEGVEKRRALGVVVGLVCLLACQRQPEEATAGARHERALVALGSAPAAESSAAHPEDLVEPYPGGRWRLADPRRLDDVVLWFRHISIRHRDVPSGLVPLNLPHWTGAPVPPRRTREEAFELARDIADQARAAPGRFAELAETLSEDVATRPLGGAVGGVSASAVRTQVLLDALQALRPGQVSRVLETGYGFHVLLRLSPPEEGRVSGSRIVIAHDDAPWVARYLPRWPVPHRSAQQALALAEEIYAQLQRDPARFGALLERYSDHQDVSRGGDFGSWSLREATPFPREVELLRRLQPGEVAPPIDSLFGVQLIQRTAERERPALACSMLRWRFDPAAPPGSPNAEATVAQQAWASARELAERPLAFGDYQRRFCCTGRSDWIAGRGEAPIERELARLTPGQVSTDPLRLRNEYMLLQRLEPEPAPARAVDVELPSPDHVDLESVVSVHGLRVLSRARPTLERLPLAPEQRARLLALHDTLPSVKGRAATTEYAALLGRVQTVLGEGTESYLAALRDGIEAWLLRVPREERMALPMVAGDFLASAPHGSGTPARRASAP